MARSAGVSGLAVAMAAGGGLLLWTGVVNRPVLDSVRDVLRGRPPGTSGTPTGPALASVQTEVDRLAKAGKLARTDASGTVVGGATASSAAIEQFVTEALAQKGKPYVWGAAGPNAFDCSGLVTWCLKKAGLDDRRRVSQQYLNPGLPGGYKRTFVVPRDECRRGDLVCWSGHIGIALSRDVMVNAQRTGLPVREANIWAGPVIRRIGAQKTGA